MDFRTDQEEFWASDFGKEYAGRNAGPELLASKIAMFSKILQRTDKITSARELGTNIGMNMLAIRALLPNVALQGVEINPHAFEQLAAIPGIEAKHGSLLDQQDWSSEQVDLCFTSGVLIHINPDELATAYERLYEGSRRYVLVAEYYNPSPVTIPYRGHSERLFKRDFAGEMMNAYPDLALIDYGFVYHRDPNFPGDDVTWFLMEKKG